MLETILGKNSIWAAFMVMVLLVACTGDNSSSLLKYSNWDLVTLNGDAPIEGRTPTLSFEENVINGVTGCNSFSSDYTLNGRNMSVGRLFVTKTYCQGRMEQERAYLEMLMSADSLTLENETLIIHTDQGDLVYQLANN